ncbi:efflux RND transporter periplasmic adaptor subunit [Fodinibius halophilus]|uniref:Efflux RND transporter periplasmic adaptor subunit n=1 Tax=Fodinibius halophilus TaxID=1736908 RepID=A0A6M1SUW8_9BACT|nr:efflux RND transporter periplasmic adaptor subunit [Fodinibius halophilus]NGP87738.1 efflux RND transporter periplasmic adaptor subunit [Fodinibius halophilus]
MHSTSKNIYRNLFFSILCIGIILSGCKNGEEEDKNPLSEEEQESAEVRPEVIFAIADSKPIYQHIESQGVVEANQSVELKPKISGYVERSYITEGRSVQKGDTLLVFDRREAKMAVQQAQNTYEEALHKYRIEMNMRTNGNNSGTNGDHKKDAGKQMVRITTGLAKAELELEQAKLDLSYTVLKAPFTGTLSTDRRLANGTYVNAGTKVGELVDDRTVRLRFDVLESELSKIESGMEVKLSGPGAEQLKGTVMAVDPVVDTKTKTGTIIVEAENRDGILSPGMTVEGRIQVLKQEGKVRVPRSAILSRDGGRTLLFKLKPENDEVHWVYVEPEALNSQWAIINHEQVAPGDTIAVDRHFALSHLQIVKPRLQTPE